MLKIDLHTHILPPPGVWPDWAARFGEGAWVSLRETGPCGARMYVGGEVFREVGRNCWDAAMRIAECDAVLRSAGGAVRVQTLSTVPVMFSYWASPGAGYDLSRWLNDEIARTVAAHPERFAGLGTLPMQAPELACRELERCVGELGLAGAQIGSHVNSWNLSEPALYPVFERAEGLGAAIFVHPWEMMGAGEMPKYWLPWLVGMPAETSRAICSVIFGGVLERLPRLRLCFAHAGGSFPGTIGRIIHGHECRPDLCAVDNPRSPREYLRNEATGAPGRFFVDSLTHDARALRGVIALLGEERVALGSDYPFPLGEAEPGALICSMPDLTDRTKARLLAGTALEFLGAGAGRFAAEGARMS